MTLGILGEITDIADGTMFVGLQTYQNNYGSPYKLCFGKSRRVLFASIVKSTLMAELAITGPKSFLVISDPVQARHLLRDANTKYDKGVLAEILEPIMGKGLIPAGRLSQSIRHMFGLSF